jgi:hypothetical protein
VVVPSTLKLFLIKLTNVLVLVGSEEESELKTMVNFRGPAVRSCRRDVSGMTDEFGTVLE